MLRPRLVLLKNDPFRIEKNFNGATLKGSNFESLENQCLAIISRIIEERPRCLPTGWAEAVASKKMEIRQGLAKAFKVVPKPLVATLSSVT